MKNSRPGYKLKAMPRRENETNRCKSKRAPALPGEYSPLVL